MSMAVNSKAKKGYKLPLLLAVAGLAFGAPTAGLALGAFSDQASLDGQDFGIFTPASVDPRLAQRVADQARARGMRFTPAASSSDKERTVTVAVRVDDNTARAISFRSAIDTAPGAGEGIAAIATSRYDLGISRDYQSFARPITPAMKLPDTVRNLSMPDLASFAPAGPTVAEKPSRFQPRIALEDNDKAGRAAGTLEGLGSQTVDLGGAYSLSRNLDVTAGVRLSQERDRLSPLADPAQDSQAVYVGTQFRF
ncbi:MAG: hypothetical protein ABJ239_05760 [Erythrobacter sp.]